MERIEDKPVEDKPVDDPSGSKESIEEKLLKCCKENKMSLLSMANSGGVDSNSYLDDVYMYNLQFITENFDELKAKALINHTRLKQIVMFIIHRYYHHMDFIDTENFKILMKLCLKLKIKYNKPPIQCEFDSDEFYNYMYKDLVKYNGGDEKTKNLFLEKYKNIIKKIIEEEKIVKKDGRKRRSKKTDGKRKSKRKSKRRSKKRSKRKI